MCLHKDLVAQGAYGHYPQRTGWLWADQGSGGKFGDVAIWFIKPIKGSKVIRVSKNRPLAQQQQQQPQLKKSKEKEEVTEESEGVSQSPKDWDEIDAGALPFGGFISQTNYHSAPAAELAYCLELAPASLWEPYLLDH